MAAVWEILQIHHHREYRAEHLTEWVKAYSGDGRTHPVLEGGERIFEPVVFLAEQIAQGWELSAVEGWQRDGFPPIQPDVEAFDRHFWLRRLQEPPSPPMTLQELRGRIELLAERDKLDASRLLRVSGRNLPLLTALLKGLEQEAIHADAVVESSGRRDKSTALVWADHLTGAIAVVSEAIDELIDDL